MKILSFGSLNLDKVYSVAHFVRPGETLSADALHEFCGGKGLNQSIALARAGVDVFHAGCVGAADGGMLLDALHAASVDTTFVHQLPCSTGHAIIQVDPSGQNCILLFGGANHQVSTQQIDETLEAFGAGDILVLQNEISNLDYLIRKAHRKELVIVLNPSPMTEAIRSLPLELVSYFLLNELEARELCGTDAEEAQFPAMLLKKYPGSHILLTLGSRGCIYQDQQGMIIHPAYRVNAVDTTAAGDTFTGYFIAAIASGASVSEALSLASSAAAISVSRSGASASIPTMDEVLHFAQAAQKKTVSSSIS